MEYKTILGDTWDMVAHKMYGDAIYANRILEANPAHVTIVVFSAGVTLTIPEVPAAISSDLPPWKRGAAL